MTISRSAPRRGCATTSEAFSRAADALDALARRDAGAYASAVRCHRRRLRDPPDHLTGVPIADTALMLERLAAARGIEAGPESELAPRA